jgi:hypothetical protein
VLDEELELPDEPELEELSGGVMNKPKIKFC